MENTFLGLEIASGSPFIHDLEIILKWSKCGLYQISSMWGVNVLAHGQRTEIII